MTKIKSNEASLSFNWKNGFNVTARYWKTKLFIIPQIGYVNILFTTRSKISEGCQCSGYLRDGFGSAFSAFGTPATLIVKNGSMLLDSELAKFQLKIKDDGQRFILNGTGNINTGYIKNRNLKFHGHTFSSADFDDQ